MVAAINLGGKGVATDHPGTAEDGHYAAGADSALDSLRQD